MTDIMHGFLGLACLSLYGEEDLQPLDPAFGISVRARNRLKEVLWWDEGSPLATKDERVEGESGKPPDPQSYIAISGG